jgi:uncharacterized small protein (DUF1192 family)
MDDDDFDIPSDAYIRLMAEEDLSVHSKAVLKDRIKILRLEITRSEQEIDQKELGKNEAEQLFK